MLGDLKGINCEEERQFDRYIANYVVVTFLGERSRKILVLHVQSYEGKHMCTPHPCQQTQLSTPQIYVLKSKLWILIKLIL